MKLFRMFIPLCLTISTSLWPAVVLAADIEVSGEISGAETYDSPEGIIFNAAVINSTANVTAGATYEVILKPGTVIKTGARFVVTNKDNDGMSNLCEMTYFGHLDEEPGDDYDGDQITNLQECQNGTDPTENTVDSDSDGLPDWWELQFGTLEEIDGRNGHADDDGISNWIEYKLGTDPTVTNEKRPGLHYEYDALGRVLKIHRIPK